MDTISERRLSQVHPALSERIHALALALQPTTIRVTAGIRTVEQQNALYAIGRTVPGEVVTNAKGTESNHVLGFAVDLVVMDKGQPDWDAQPWIELAPRFSLRSGAEWQDRPHLELIEVPADPSGESQQAYLFGGITAVWKETNLA